ncbi:hypothetical protein FOL47_000469 [Perkinsus chesapeaki]|uniref:TOG domain-containing protein n=1 Tax=Perkinsus chesapeaki TaxID=330153 RepID=A0A7J6MML6_PERCH|nr:hypothetical protein FOL47_000469 [Perkinsus chesapeaki]
MRALLSYRWKPPRLRLFGRTGCCPQQHRFFASDATTGSSGSRIHGSGRWRQHAPDRGSGSWLYGKVEKETDKRTKSVNTTFLWLSTGVFMFGMCFVAVPLYDMYCKSTGQGSTGGFATTGHKEYKPPPKEGKASKRVIKITFAGAVQSTLKWDFYPEQKSVYVTPGETALAFFRAKNRTNKPIIGMSTYHMIPLEAGLYFNKIQCFCFDEQLLGPHEEVDMPVFFFIDPDIMDDRRMDTVDEITLTYLFGPTQSEIPDEYEDLKQEIQTRKLGQPTTAMPKEHFYVSEEHVSIRLDDPLMTTPSPSPEPPVADMSVAGAVAGLDENASGAANSSSENITVPVGGDALKDILRTPRSSLEGVRRRSSQRRHSHSGTPVEREDRVRGSSVMELVRNFESTIKKKARRPPLQPVMSERSKPTVNNGDDDSSDDNNSNKNSFLHRMKMIAESRSGMRVRTWKEAIAEADIPEQGGGEGQQEVTVEEPQGITETKEPEEATLLARDDDEEGRTPEKEVEVSCTSSQSHEWATPFAGQGGADEEHPNLDGVVEEPVVEPEGAVQRPEDITQEGETDTLSPTADPVPATVEQVVVQEKEEEPLSAVKHSVPAVAVKPVVVVAPKPAATPIRGDASMSAASAVKGKSSTKKTPCSRKGATPRQSTGKKSARRNSTPAAQPTPIQVKAVEAQSGKCLVETPVPTKEAVTDAREATPRSVRIPTPKPSAVLGDDPAVTPPPSKENSPIKANIANPVEVEATVAPEACSMPAAAAAPLTQGGIPSEAELAEAEPDYSSVSLEDRLKEKQWQARLSGYNEIDEIFSGEDTDKQKLAVELLMAHASVVTSETNPRSQEGACKAIAACTHGPGFAIAPFLSGLLEKYMAGNPKIQTSAVECLARSIEGQSGLAKEVVEGVCEHARDLLKPPKGKKMPSKGIMNKQISGCLAALTSLLEAFGMAVVPPKEFLSIGVEACGSTDRGVREAGYSLLVELYQWLPDADACGNGLPDNQMKEFKTRCEKLGECQPKKPTKFPHGSKPSQEGDASGAMDSSKTTVQSTEDAAYDMLQPQDIFKMLPKDFVSQVTSATKWVEKRAAIAQLTALATKHRKLTSGDSSAPNVIQCLMKVVKLDQNIPVATEACSALCAVANGLRGEVPHSRMLFSTMLTKVKDKNAGATGCIDALLKYQSLSLDSRLVEEFAGVINDKNPIGRREVLGICSRALPFVSSELLLPMAETVLLPCLDESDKTVREAACVLGDLILTQDDSLQGVLLTKLHSMTAARRKAVEERMKCLKVASTPLAAANTKPSVPTIRTGSTPASGGGQGSRVREISVESTASRRVRVPGGSKAPGTNCSFVLWQGDWCPRVARTTSNSKGDITASREVKLVLLDQGEWLRLLFTVADSGRTGGGGGLLRQATLTSSSSTIDAGAALGVELVPAAGSRLRRQHNEKHSMWPVEDIPEALVSAMHNQWNQSVNTHDACSALLLQKMFAPRGAFAEFVIAIDFWADHYRTVDEAEKSLLDEVFDLLTKWCTWLLSTCKPIPTEPPSHVLVRPFTERECHVLIPSLLDRMGHKMAAFRSHIKALVTTHFINSEALVSPKAMVPMLISCIQTSKNKKSVADCLELLIGILAQHQGTVTTGRGVKDVGRVLMSLYNDKDAAVREFAQAAIGHFVRSTGTEETIPRLREILMEPGFPLKQDHRNALNSKFDKWLLEKGGDCSINDDNASNSTSSRIHAPPPGRRVGPSGIARPVAGHRRALTRVGAPMHSAAPALPALPSSAEAPSRAVTSTIVSPPHSKMQKQQPQQAAMMARNKGLPPPTLRETPLAALSDAGQPRVSSPGKEQGYSSEQCSHTSVHLIEQHSMASSSMDAPSLVESSNFRIPGMPIDPACPGRVSGGRPSLTLIPPCMLSTESDWSIRSTTPADELAAACEALLRGGDGDGVEIGELSKKTKEAGESDPRKMLSHCDAFLNAAACAVELTLIARHGADVESSERVLDLANFLATSATALDECRSTSIKNFLRALLVSLSDREFRHKHYADWQRANMAVVTAMSNAETTIVYKALLELSREDERKDQLRVLITRCIDKLNRELVESGSMGDISPDGALAQSSSAIKSDDSIKRIVQTVCQIVGFAEVGEYMGVYVNDSDERQGWKNLMRDAEEQGRRTSDANGGADRPVAG